MDISKKKPYVIHMAEIIYLEVSKIKKENSDISNIEAIERFIGSKLYEEISNGKFHDTWFKSMEINNFLDEDTGKKIPDETIKLLKIQKEATIKQLIEFPKFYHAKSSFPLEISQRAFNFLWRMCESYELWCNESKQRELINLDLLN